ncbi:MAG: hypothetical protein RLZZ127_512 [Planctomycetota bacterium]|jgi:hypothetical protein
MSLATWAARGRAWTTDGLRNEAHRYAGPLAHHLLRGCSREQLNALAWLARRHRDTFGPVHQALAEQWCEPSFELHGPYAPGDGDKDGRWTAPVPLAPAGHPEGAMGWIRAVPTRADSPTTAIEGPSGALKSIQVTNVRDAVRSALRHIGLDAPMPRILVALGGEQGESMGLSMLVATLAFHLQVPVPNDLCISGQVTANHLAPVGDLGPKGKAAQRWGFRRFLTVDGGADRDIPIEVVLLPQDLHQAIDQILALLLHGHSHETLATRQLEMAKGAAPAEQDGWGYWMALRAWRLSSNPATRHEAWALCADRSPGREDWSILREIRIPEGGHRIRIVRGDLSAPPIPMDLVLCSVFADAHDRDPHPGTLIHAIQQRYETYTIHPDRATVDLRAALDTWFQAAPATMLARNLGMIQCRPFGGGGVRPISDILENLCLSLEVVRLRKGIPSQTLAMPVIGTGRQGFDRREVITALIPALTQAMHRLASPATWHIVEFHPERAQETSQMVQDLAAWDDPVVAFLLESINATLATSHRKHTQDVHDTWARITTLARERRPIQEMDEVMACLYRCLGNQAQSPTRLQCLLRLYEMMQGGHTPTQGSEGSVS